MNKAFEETTMKNVPIDQFWSFKWRNGVQNWNLREKLSKIGPVGNFDFWSKVNAKSQSQSQSQLVQGQSQRILVRVGSGFPGRVTGRAVDPLTSSYDVSLTWTRTDVALVDVDVLAWLLTWTDVVRWHQQLRSARVKRVLCHRRMEEQPEIPVALEGVCKVGWGPSSQVLKIGGRGGLQGGACTKKTIWSEESEAAREILSEAIFGAWLDFGWPDFWVFLGGCLGARLWDRFRQAKAWYAQIW